MKYVITKVVEAEEMTRDKYYTSSNMPAPPRCYTRVVMKIVPKGEETLDDGQELIMKVTHEDGYVPLHQRDRSRDGVISMHPKDKFLEHATLIEDGMTFGQALELLKQGKKLQRKEWVTTGKYIILDTTKSIILIDPVEDQVCLWTIQQVDIMSHTWELLSDTSILQNKMDSYE